MFANDIKKGMQITLKSGFSGVMADNKKGSIRTVTVEGVSGTETGSTYAKDIRSVLNPATNQWERVELSPTQVKQAKAISAFGF